jgi:hypothetical protein
MGSRKKKDLIGEKTSMGYEPKITILCFLNVKLNKKKPKEEKEN